MWGAGGGEGVVNTIHCCPREESITSCSVQGGGGGGGGYKSCPGGNRLRYTAVRCGVLYISLGGGYVSKGAPS